MKSFKFLMVGFIVFLMCSLVYTEEILVGFEPLPPLIIDENSGFTIDMLREIEKKTDMKFIIKIMPYNRAKYSLGKGEVDLAGHTPYKMETADFYEFAVDVDWHVTSKIDLYSVKKENLSLEKYKTFKKIGTPRGNEAFFAELYGIPVENFFINELDILVKMVHADRLDVLLFERSASMSTIQKFKYDNINYVLLDDSILVGFAVNKNTKGMALKKRLEDAIAGIDQSDIFKDYFKYTELPKQGIVKH